LIATNHLLFSYGTLQLEKVQLENYGRLLVGQPDKLTGYKIENLHITDSNVLAKSQVEYHPIAIKSEDVNDFINGVVFEITDTELTETDKYEVNEYHRIHETLKSGKRAWVYVAKIMAL
jgi:gamma-glutamylcyclotransferase (GGCT)/AIG2-like uncharacterized protein YtfP